MNNEDPLTQLATPTSDTIAEKMEQLYRMDATALYLRRLASRQEWSELEMYKRMVVQLADEKKRYFDQWIHLMETRIK